MLIGFGQTELNFQKQELKSLRDYFIDWQTARKYDLLFDEKSTKAIEYFLKARSEELRELADSYKNSENYPSRYSTFYYSVLNNRCDICVVFDFSHINRRHALSPDGWAMLKQTQIFHINCHDKGLRK